MSVKKSKQVEQLEQIEKLLDKHLSKTIKVERCNKELDASMWVIQMSAGSSYFSGASTAKEVFKIYMKEYDECISKAVQE